MFKSTLPKYYHAFSSLLNKSDKTNIKRLQGLQGQWDRDILYQFITLCCKRNSKFFSHWALINTASSYGGRSLDLEVFFGIAVTVSTMLCKLNTKYPFKFVMQKTMNTLSTLDTIGISVFDNLQVMQSFKFQRGGKSSDVSLRTSLMFIEPMVPRLISQFRWPDQKVKLTYLNQKIPSLPGMPRYESIRSVEPHVFDGSTVCSTEMDITGERVDAWASLAMLASQIYKLQCLVKTKDNETFEFQHKDNLESMKRLQINSKLRKNRKGFYQKVKHFQYNETIKWRGKPREAHVIIPPVSPHDETTNTGAAKVILSLLTLFGILESSHDDCNSPDTANIRLAQNAKQQFLVMVTDGLSQMRARQFSELIDETCTSYRPCCRAMTMLQKALE